MPSIFPVEPIGIIHTPYTVADKNAMPIQSARSDVIGSIELKDVYSAGLSGLQELSHVYLLYMFHQLTGEGKLQVTPFLDDQQHGIFATRYPDRPYHIGFSVVRLLSVKGCRIEFCGADMLDETPLIDIKPYLPEFDIFSPEKTGWYASRKFQQK